MPQVHASCSNSIRRESEVSIKWILWLPYLKSVSANQSPKLFTHYCRIVNTSGGGIGGRVHNILIPETSVQDVEHKAIILFSQIFSLEFHTMGCQDSQSKELIIKDQANGKSQRIFASTHERSTFCNLKMVNKICQQQHIIIDQPVEQLDKRNFQCGGCQGHSTPSAPSAP